MRGKLPPLRVIALVVVALAAYGGYHFAKELKHDFEFLFGEEGPDEHFDDLPTPDQKSGA